MQCFALPSLKKIFYSKLFFSKRGEEEMLKKMLLAAACLAVVYGCTEMREKRTAVITAPTISPEAEYVGSETCLECHEDFDADGRNIHMKIAEFEAATYRHGCESCHGPGSLHADSEDPEQILRYGDDGMATSEVSGVCLTCHQSGEQKDLFHGEPPRSSSFFPPHHDTPLCPPGLDPGQVHGRPVTGRLTPVKPASAPGAYPHSRRAREA